MFAYIGDKGCRGHDRMVSEFTLP